MVKQGSEKAIRYLTAASFFFLLTIPPVVSFWIGDPGMRKSNDQRLLVESAQINNGEASIDAEKREARVELPGCRFSVAGYFPGGAAFAVFSIDENCRSELLSVEPLGFQPPPKMWTNISGPVTTWGFIGLPSPLAPVRLIKFQQLTRRDHPRIGVRFRLRDDGEVSDLEILWRVPPGMPRL